MIFKLLVGAAAANSSVRPRRAANRAQLPSRRPSSANRRCSVRPPRSSSGRGWRGGGKNLWQSYSRTLETKRHWQLGDGRPAGNRLRHASGEKNPRTTICGVTIRGFRICVVRCYTVWVRELENWVNRHVDDDRRRLLTKTFLDLAIWLPAGTVYFVWMALLGDEV